MQEVVVAKGARRRQPTTLRPGVLRKAIRLPLRLRSGRAVAHPQNPLEPGVFEGFCWHVRLSGYKVRP